MKKYIVTFSPKFIKTVKKLTPPLKDSIIERVEMLKDGKNHEVLKVHKLKGILKGRYSFSVDYERRIVFTYSNENTIYLLNFGGHDVYDK
jgi:mRNA-degrading endonuclease YafQ of YafQ-DinJ toxin-antitoxin module